MNEERVIFIRGTGRCGSKNLVTMLGHHPALAHMPVNQVLPEELIDWSRSQLQASDPRISDEAVASACRAYFAAFGRALADGDGILLQKSTRNAHHLATLLDYWPSCRIVYLVRHPIGVVEALVNAAAHDEGTRRPDYGYRAGVADSLLQWYTELNEYVSSTAFGHPRLMQVHFGDLVRDPHGTVEGICGFLGIDSVPLPSYGPPEEYDEPFVLNERERQWVIASTTNIAVRLGFDPFQWSAAVPADNERFVDLYPECRLSAVPPTLDVVELTRLALSEADRRGYRRVGLFGAGYFAQRVCPNLADTPVEIVGLFDDNPALAHQRIGTVPVFPAESAGERGVQAVVPMTFVHQEAMARRWSRLFGDDIPVIALWDENSGQRTESVHWADRRDLQELESQAT